ncbi:MAG: SBBP repeat-containing protein, partial [Thermodesulfobacteriota bacterium]|nr:SBBP repeat-containing protein [Thermodesulfobacteriota bacterium]
LTDNAFITKLSADGSSLKYSTYLGGTRADRSLGVAVDSSGRAYVAGWTESDDFPTKNAFQGSLAEPPWEYPTDAPPVGYKDAFAAVVKADGSEIITSTYLGGSDDDQAVGVALDGNGLVYLAGTTEAADFPTIEPVQAAVAGHADAFLTILVLDGSEPVFSTYLGGAEDDRAAGLAVDENMAVYLAGNTESDDFPTAGPFQPARAGDQDVFVVKIDADDPDNNEENQGGGSSGGTIQISTSEETNESWFFSGGCFISEAGKTSGRAHDISDYTGLIPICLFFAGLFFYRRL